MLTSLLFASILFLMKTYYYLDGDETKGPFADGVIEAMVKRGHLDNNTLVCEAGSSEWEPWSTTRTQPEKEESIWTRDLLGGKKPPELRHGEDEVSEKHGLNDEKYEMNDPSEERHLKTKRGLKRAETFCYVLWILYVVSMIIVSFDQHLDGVGFALVAASIVFAIPILMLSCISLALDYLRKIANAKN